MELTLNLVWLIAGLTMVATWLMLPQRKHTLRIHQALCLTIAILLLLPVISLSDDLVALQTAREADCCLRRAQDGNLPHVNAALWAVPANSAYEFRIRERKELLVQVATVLPQYAGILRLPFSRPPPAA